MRVIGYVFQMSDHSEATGCVQYMCTIIGSVTRQGGLSDIKRQKRETQSYNYQVTPKITEYS